MVEGLFRGRLKSCDFPDTQYVDEKRTPTQIFMHHTAGSADPYSVVDWWCSNGERVGTSFIIGRGSGHNKGHNKDWADGDIVQCFSSSKWAWHLGLKKRDLVKGGKTSTVMNKSAIGIELCNWGYLIVNNGKFLNYEGHEIDADDVITLDKPYRGYTHWQKYTDAQLESSRLLLRFLCDRYDIPVQYKGDSMFDISPACLKGEKGIWTHTSVRKDKFDCFPQLELKQMLQSL